MTQYRFDAFVLDTDRASLSGPAGPIRLRAKAFRVLVELLEAAPRILSTERLLDQIWGTRHLTRNTVAQTIQEVRSALKCSETAELIENVPKLGYRMAVPVARVVTDATPGGEPPSPQLSPTPANSITAPAAPVADAATHGAQRTGRTVVLGMAVLILVGLGLFAWGWWRTGPPHRFMSVADLGIQVDGHGGATVRDSLRESLALGIEQSWEVRPVDLSGSLPERRTLSELRSSAAGLTARFRVQVWYGGQLALRAGAHGPVLDGELLMGSGKDATVVTLPVRELPLDRLHTLAGQLSERLADVGQWSTESASLPGRSLAARDNALITEASVLSSRGRPDAALEVLAQLDPAVQKDPAFLLAKARALMQQGRKQAVRDLLVDPITLPELQEVRAWASGDNAEAIEIIRQRLAAAPDSARLGRELVAALIDTQQHALAMRELDQLQLRPMSLFDQDEFQLLRARILNAEGSHQAAVELLDAISARLAELGSSSLLLRARNEQALATAMQGKWDAALALYQSVLEGARTLGLSALEANASFQIADIYKAQGQRDRAAALLRSTIQRFSGPDYLHLLPELQLGLGYVALDDGRLAEAEAVADALSTLIRTYEQPLHVAAFRSELALLRGSISAAITLMQDDVERACTSGAYSEGARLLLRLAHRHLLAANGAAARSAVEQAYAACRSVGFPDSCADAVRAHSAALHPDAAAAQTAIDTLGQRRRALRDLAGVALLHEDLDQLALASRAIQAGEGLFEVSPAHYQAMHALSAAYIAQAGGAPVTDAARAAAGRFPELLTLIHLLDLHPAGGAPLQAACASTGAHPHSELASLWCAGWGFDSASAAVPAPAAHTYSCIKPGA